MAKNLSVFAIYANRESAEEGIDELRGSGFRNADISALLPHNVGTKDLAHEKATRAPEAAAAGAASGAVIGGALGWLAGIGTLGIPGLGPFIAAGPIMALLAGLGAGGTAGGLIGALAGLGVPEYEAKRYEGRLRSGGILVSVHCDNSQWAHKARVILEQTGAQNISTRSERKADYAVSERPMLRRALVHREARMRERADPNGRHDEFPNIKAAGHDLPADHDRGTDYNRHPLTHVGHLTVGDTMAREIEHGRR